MFEDKTILITGAASGLGLVLSEKLSKDGAKLILVDKKSKELGDLQERLFRFNKNVVVVNVDITDDKNIHLIKNKIAETFGRLDILINSAGILEEGYFENISVGDFHEVMEDNYFGTINVIKTVLDYLKESSGRIINIASISGLQGVFGHTSYCSSKHAIMGLSKCLRYELKRFNVVVQVVCPSEFNSPMVDKLEETRTPENRENVHMIPKYSAEYVADQLIKNILTNNFVIIPGFLAKVFAYLSLFFPSITEKIINRKIGSVSKNKKVCNCQKECMNKCSDVSAVSCDSYKIELLEKAIKNAIELAGGLPEKIKPGSRVLLKPNLLTAKSPDTPTVTHPEFIRAVICALKALGITDITVGDSPAGKHDWDKLWEKTGVKQVAEDENVTLMPFENSRMLHLDGHRIPVLKELQDFDGVIFLPKLKTHLLTKITGAVKNSYGLVVGQAKSHFHTLYPSPKKMSNFIGDLYGELKPDFVIMDAIECMEGDGPNAGVKKHLGVILASSDGVATDSAACEVYGYKPYDVLHLLRASDQNFGITALSKIVKRGNGWSRILEAKAKKSKADFLFRIPEKLFFIIKLLTKCRPVVKPNTCKYCGICEKTCPQRAIYRKKKKYCVNSSRCVLCMCCIEACPYQSISLQTGFIWNRYSS